MDEAAKTPGIIEAVKAYLVEIKNQMGEDFDLGHTVDYIEQLVEETVDEFAEENNLARDDDDFMSDEEMASIVNYPGF